MPTPSLARPERTAQVRDALQRAPVVALLGPRQCGKTTLARSLQPDALYDLEDSVDRQALAGAPQATLAAQRGMVVIDEIQTMPELLPILRVLADRPDPPARFLILGSAAPELVRGAAESLAGRVAFVHLSGFDLGEVGADAQFPLWHRGGFPRSFLAADDRTSYSWRQDFIETFLTRDAAQFGVTLPPERLRRFWTMLAHDQGSALNAAALARGVDIDQKTAARYVDVLAGTYLLRRLPPWFVNTKRRLVKAPKVYLRDSGVLHALLGLRDASEVMSHPRFGSSFEGFAIEQVIGAMAAERDAHFWGTHAGPELDLVVPRGGKLYGFECKFEDAPTGTRSMHAAAEELGLAHLYVVYPGTRSYPIATGMTALPLREVGRTCRAL